MNHRALWLLWVSLSGGSAFAQCLNYPPDVVTVSGVVHLESFFGPPGYGEDPVHDSRETQARLVLDQPICVHAGDDSRLEEPESNQRIVTLVPQSQDVGFTQLQGKHIRVRGTLFHAHSGHHHTPILVAVAARSDIEVAPE